MKTQVRITSPSSSKAAVLAVIVQKFSGKTPPAVSSVDRALGTEFARVIAAGDFAGERDETAVLYPGKGPKRAVLIGVGEKLDANSIRRAASALARQAVKWGGGEVAVLVPDDKLSGIDMELAAQVVVEGVGQGAWNFESLRSKRISKGDVTTLTLLTDTHSKSEVERGRVRGTAIAIGQSFARDLQMRPGNHLTPSDVAKEAQKLGRMHGFKVSVKGKTQLAKENFNALLAVAQGSAQEPKLITMEYRGGGEKQRPVCLVGKGVTFDSGGISLKPPLNMEEMKFDMSGAAAVLGTFAMLGVLKPKINVVGIVPATENLPSSTAIKPGDVVKAHGGKTIEIINTDAEGRLILCDALSYAKKFKPAITIDAATLTGAIVIALGDQAAGLMSNDPALVEEIKAASEDAGEPVWELPLWDAYREQLKSDTADIKNIGGRAAGSITAGWFLKEFAGSGPWAHLDIAGTAYTESDRPHMPKGPTGMGVRLFSNLLLRRLKG
ncbi:MAG: leucyl aminopeptidase [Gemmatimonadota bacterium]|nr:leucyl aminopeptidase [Gemmatimonadota bacterium]